jgi:hypothetical protein
MTIAFIIESQFTLNHRTSLAVPVQVTFLNVSSSAYLVPQYIGTVAKDVSGQILGL